MDIQQRIEILSAWGSRLEQKMHSGYYQNIFNEACSTNPWFTQEFIKTSMNAIVSRYLSKDKLQEWVSAYKIPSMRNPKSIALIMAGNIPLVGFHDLLSVIISGHNAIIKASSKDRLLPELILMELKELSAELFNKITIKDIYTCDAAIATGSDNSARYFSYLYAHVPHIIRKNRNSVAILNGSESKDEMEQLADDVFQYFGLGCRNVSSLLLPADYDSSLLKTAFSKYAYFMDHQKYANNYRYYKSLFSVNQDEFCDYDHFLLKADNQTSSPLSVLHYSHYTSTEQLTTYLKQNKDRIQVILSADLSIENCNIFGSSQHPELWDYADNIDTLDFLIKL